MLYSFSVKIIAGVLFIVSLFSKKINLFIKGRYNWREKLKNKISSNDEIIWIHCASLGEFEQGRPIIDQLKKDYPKYKILLTFFSPSGYEVRKNYENADIISYLPLDTFRNAKDFIKIVNPKIVIFVKYEIWPNYLKVLKKYNIPTFIISAIFFRKFFYFKWYGKWILKFFKIPKTIFVQNEKSEKLLNEYKIFNTKISGDTRFDRVLELKNKNESIFEIELFKGNDLLVVAGSTWDIDESYLVEFINNCDRKIKFIIAPHNLNKKNIIFLESRIKKETIKFTSIKKDTDLSKYKILILDTMGMLMKAYKYSDLTYIGGGFQKGIHNILEPATFGNPIIIGNKYSQFMEAIELVKREGAKVVSNKNEFINTFDILLEDKNKLLEMSKLCEEYIYENKDAKNIIIEEIRKFL